MSNNVFTDENNIRHFDYEETHKNEYCFPLIKTSKHFCGCCNDREKEKKKRQVNEIFEILLIGTLRRKLCVLVVTERQLNTAQQASFSL
jgi:hypothetical protein